MSIYDQVRLVLGTIWKSTQLCVVHVFVYKDNTELTYCYKTKWISLSVTRKILLQHAWVLGSKVDNCIITMLISENSRSLPHMNIYFTISAIQNGSSYVYCLHNMHS